MLIDEILDKLTALSLTWIKEAEEANDKSSETKLAILDCSAQLITTIQPYSIRAAKELLQSRIN